jgi:hypothetical protein
MVSDIIAFGDGFFWKANKSSFVAASRSAGAKKLAVQHAKHLENDVH